MIWLVILAQVDPLYSFLIRVPLLLPMECHLETEYIFWECFMVDMNSMRKEYCGLRTSQMYLYLLHIFLLIWV